MGGYRGQKAIFVDGGENWSQEEGLVCCGEESKDPKDLRAGAEGLGLRAGILCPPLMLPPLRVSGWPRRLEMGEKWSRWRLSSSQMQVMKSRLTKAWRGTQVHLDGEKLLKLVEKQAARDERKQVCGVCKRLRVGARATRRVCSTEGALLLGIAAHTCPTPYPLPPPPPPP